MLAAVAACALILAPVTEAAVQEQSWGAPAPPAIPMLPGTSGAAALAGTNPLLPALVAAHRLPARVEHGAAVKVGGRTSGLVRLAGSAPRAIPAHLLPARLGRRGPAMTITVVLRRSDQAGFERYLHSIYPRNGALGRHFLSQGQLADRFGPSRAVYEHVGAWLEARGLTWVQGSTNRLTVTVRGSQASISRAFATPIRDFRAQGRIGYTNTDSPALPGRLAAQILAVSGLSSLNAPAVRPVDASTEQAHPTGPAAKGAMTSNGLASCSNALADIGISVGITSMILLAAPLVAVLLELELFNIEFWFWGAATGNSLLSLIPSYPIGVSLQTVANDFSQCFLALGHKYFPGSFGPGVGKGGTDVGAQSASQQAGDPGQRIGLLEFDTFHPADVTNWLNFMGFPTSLAGELSQVPVNGGVGTPGPGESEVLVDIDTAIGMNPSPTNKFVVYDAPPDTSFVQMFNTMVGDGDTVISNSWAQCEDQTSQADAQAIDSVLAQAAASGVTVINGSGDDGSRCLDGSPNTVSVPADSPSATAVGGSSPSHGGEVWWNGAGHVPATGQGGFGTSTLFTRPSYQDGLTNSAGRSVPDLVVNADPGAGIQICQGDDGGCPSPLRWGGTSMAAPELATLVAFLNENLGHNVGDLNAILYPRAGTAGLNPISGSDNDFAHVGLGSPDFTEVVKSLTNTPTGAVSATESQAFGLASSAAGPIPGALQVNLLDANGFPVPGKTVALTASTGCNAQASPANGVSDNDGTVSFTVTDSGSESCTFTAKDTTDGVTLSTRPQLTFLPPEATGGRITSDVSQVLNNGTSKATITVYLQDSKGRPASGKTVTLAQGGGQSDISPSTSPGPGDTGAATTDGTGSATFTVTDTSAESVDFTATDVSDSSLPVPGSAEVNFGPTSATCETSLPKSVGGFTVSAFATGFAYDTESIVYPGNFTEAACTTAESAPAIDAAGNAYIPDGADGTIHVLGPAGGQPTAANQLPDANFPGGSLGQLAFGKDGSLYAGLIQSGGSVNNPEIVQLDPTTGAVIKVVASSSTGLPDCPFVVTVDPLSGDLFTDDECSGFAASTQISRIHDPAGANPTVSSYTTGPCNLGMQFAPDGTLYLANCNGEVDSIGGTNTSNPSPTKVASVSSTPFAVAVAASNSSGHATKLLVFANIFPKSGPNSGHVISVDLTHNPAVVTQEASGPATFFIAAIAADGCGYGSIPGKVVRVGPASCGSAPSGPRLALSETAGSATPQTGSAVGFTATLTGAPNAAGVPVTFAVTGPNAAGSLVNTDGSGQATMNYTGAQQGIDTVTASVVINGTAITSAPLQAHWLAGRDLTFLTLNSSQTGGASGQAVTLAANLVDATAGAPLAGAGVTLALSDQSCQATTDASGNASCSVTPTGDVGLEPMSATYAGDSTHTPATAANVFELGGLGLPSPPPPSPPPGPGPGPPPATGGVPVNTARPVVSGTPTPGHSLTCSTGTWTNSPTAFAYLFKRNGKAIAGATASRYTVQIPDEAQNLSCQVTASNAHGSGAPAGSAAVLVALKNTTRCPRPTGRLSGGSVGVLKLGMSKHQARRKLKRFGVTHNAFDNFCLFAGWGIRAGYPSSKLVRALPKRERGHVQGVILLLTANPFYAFDKTRPGAKLTKSLSRRLHLGKRFHIGANNWYIAPGKKADGVLKVRRGVVQEVGVADKRLLSARKAQQRFLHSFSTT